jgi:hypothetical protein
MLNTGLQPARVDRKLHNFLPAIAGKKQGAEADSESGSEQSPVVLLREPLAHNQITGGFVLAKTRAVRIGFGWVRFDKTCGSVPRPQWFETHRSATSRAAPLLHGAVMLLAMRGLGTST